MKDQLAIVGGIIGVLLGLLTIATLVYTAGRSDAKTAAAIRRLCEHIAVLESIENDEHPSYYLRLNATKGCDE